MTRFSDRIAAYVKAEILRAMTTGAPSLSVGTVVTSPSQSTSLPLTVVFDGSALAVPVKQVRGLPMTAGTRVVLGKFGSDWVILGGLTNPATGTGTSRIVIGADVPPELNAFGMDTAILVYLNDKLTGQEAGYFFIGSSNRFDGTGTNRVLAFGNVVYPTLGDPLSATMSNVKTNFQQGMWNPFPQTIFKDEQVVLWTDFMLDIANGATKFQVAGSSKLIAQIDDNDIRAGQPGTASTVETWHNATLQNTWANFGAPFVNAKYRYIASPPKSVEVIGTVTGGTSANGTILFNLPAGYRPATQQRNVIYAFGTTLNIATETPALDTTTGGDVKLLACVNATILTFHFTISLDA